MRKAFVLGAREGNIGAAIAARLIQDGWGVRSTDCLVEDGARPPGGNLPNAEVAKQFGYVQTAKGWYGRYDVPSFQEFATIDADALIITLGSTYKEHFCDVHEHDLRRVLDACLVMPLVCAKRYVAAVERDRRLLEGEGMAPGSEHETRHIVFIGSYAHNHPFTNGTAYCAAKAGIDMAARTLGWELTDRGYRVHVVHPWHVKGTPMWQEVERGVMESKGWTKEQADAYADRDLKMPDCLKREDVAEVVRVLLSEPAMEWLSGTAVELTGGTR